MVPLFAIPIFYAIMKTSKHPFMINLNHKLNLLHCFNIAFVVGLALVPTPTAYHFTIIGLGLGHLTVKYLGRILLKMKNIIKM